jgi:FMN phosphatase YigB (HAD superfamily)
VDGSQRIFLDWQRPALPLAARALAETYRDGDVLRLDRALVALPGARAGRRLKELLVELEVGHIFDVSIISGLEGIEKPDPGIFELALERAATTPRTAVHIGDSYRMDVEPATAVGMNAVLLDRSGRHPEIDCPTIASLHELPAVVAEL